MLKQKISSYFHLIKLGILVALLPYFAGCGSSGGGISFQVRDYGDRIILISKDFEVINLITFEQATNEKLLSRTAGILPLGGSFSGDILGKLIRQRVRAEKTELTFAKTGMLFVHHRHKNLLEVDGKSYDLNSKTFYSFIVSESGDVQVNSREITDDRTQFDFQKRWTEIETEIEKQ